MDNTSNRKGTRVNPGDERRDPRKRRTKELKTERPVKRSKKQPEKTRPMKTSKKQYKTYVRTIRISHYTVKRPMETMAHYNGNCPLCGYSLDMSSFAVQQHGHCACVSMN